MDVVYSTTELQAETKSGKTKYWVGAVLTDGENYYTQTEYWQEGGFSQLSEPKLVKTTNAGKANERGGLEQGIFNIKSLVAKQQDKGYYGKGVEKLDVVLPMLANKWVDKKHLVTYPVMVQPKLDGVRMLMKDGVAWTRKGKLFPDGVLNHILINTNGVTLDGELILDTKKYTFQDTMRAVKKCRKESEELVFHVFDIVDDSPFDIRFAKLSNFIRVSSAIKVVITYEVKNEEELMKLHSGFILQGYEGTIIRTLDGKYEVGHRSSDLLKMKDFDDDEFVITAVLEGDGKDKGAAIFECVTHDLLSTFRVRPRGTIEWRREVYKDREYVGKELTVRFQGYSEDGIPRFPVGISIREEVQG